MALVSLLGLVNCSSITEESTGTSKTKLTVKKETTSIKTYLPLGKLLITSLYFYVFHFKRNIKLNFKFQTDEQHQIETKNTGTATADTSAENYRMRRPRDRHESVCWTWLGHRLFILIFNIKLLIKFVCKRPFIFYLYSLLQFFNFRTKIPLRPRKTAIAQTPPPPPPQRPLAVLRDEGGNGRCPLLGI